MREVTELPNVGSTIGICARDDVSMLIRRGTQNQEGQEESMRLFPEVTVFLIENGRSYRYSLGNYPEICFGDFVRPDATYPLSPNAANIYWSVREHPQTSRYFQRIG